MKVLAIRFCTVSPEAAALAGFFGALGVPQMDLSGILPAPADGSFGGAIFMATDSWIESSRVMRNPRPTRAPSTDT